MKNDDTPPQRPIPHGTVRDARAKIRTIEELAALSNAAQQDGKTVVMAHGVFDLVHLGHVRHLLEARREGDVLIVTITADKHVNKGPGRPIFGEHMRAEMLATLEYVDWVGINPTATSEDALDLIRPNIYVKGSDYENPEDDLTGKIVEEREAVERHGGRIVFTKDITFSSSFLINRYLDVYDAPLQDFLEDMRGGATLNGILQYVDRAADMKVLLVGDAIIDEYRYVSPMGKSAKENMIATRFIENELFAGGVFAAANHVAGFCKRVEVITALGSSNSYEQLIRSSLKPNVVLTPLRVDGIPTTRKIRYVDEAYLRKLFEVYDFDDTPLSKDIDDDLNNLIAERAKANDLVIAADFGHSLISKQAIETLSNTARFLSVNTQTNSANLGYNLVTRYPRADMICVDSPEAQLAVGDRHSSIEEVVATRLCGLIDTDRIIVTQGKQGCVVWSRGGAPKRIPAFTKSVLDTVGAGDAFLSVASVMAAAGAPIEIVGFVGNAAGAMKVGIVGHRRAVEKVPLLKYVTTLLK